MIRTIAVALLFALSLAACGGGGSDNSGPKPLTISMYGKPVISASAVAAHAQVRAVAAAASDASTSTDPDVQATVQSLQDALAARGVTADITPQVMSATALHEIVTTDYNGKSPTPDQFKTDPSSWLIVNFQLDDMVTPVSDPTQQAAMVQFSQDLIVFSQWAAVAGKAVFAVAPIPTCDAMDSASAGVQWAIDNALSNGGPLRVIGQVPMSIAWPADGGPPIAAGTAALSHLGADCRTPDAYLQNALLDSIADEIAAAYKQQGGASPASSASVAGT